MQLHEDGTRAAFACQRHKGHNDLIVGGMRQSGIASMLQDHVSVFFQAGFVSDNREVDLTGSSAESNRIDIGRQAVFGHEMQAFVSLGGGCNNKIVKPDKSRLWVSLDALPETLLGARETGSANTHDPGGRLSGGRRTDKPGPHVSVFGPIKPCRPSSQLK